MSIIPKPALKWLPVYDSGYFFLIFNKSDSRNLIAGRFVVYFDIIFKRKFKHRLIPLPLHNEKPLLKTHVLQLLFIEVLLPSVSCYDAKDVPNEVYKLLEENHHYSSHYKNTKQRL